MAVRDGVIISSMDPTDLGSCLRGWRDRLSPAEAGLPVGPRRRAAGLRRQELATLAGLSVEYLSRLEQGRAEHPSVSVLAPLARALRLTESERDQLYRLAGHAPPSPGTAPRHVTPSLRRIVDRLEDCPVLVIDPAWEVVEANRLARPLLGEDGVTGNALRRLFSDAPTRVIHPDIGEAAFEAAAVTDVRAARSRWPDDHALRALVDELLAISPRFARLWDEPSPGASLAGRKVVRHPDIGPITLDCDTLDAAGTSLRLVVYTAQPGSPDATALRLLETVGTQQL